MSALVSVVIPSYNCEQFIDEALGSVLGQSMTDLEIIVVDDGSTDGTRERLSAYPPPVRWIGQSNRGPSAARNSGMRLARGKWLAFLDADDLWHRDKLKVQLDIASRLGSVSLIGSAAMGPLPECLPSDPSVRELSVRDFLVSNPMGVSSVLLWRQSVEEVGPFDETLWAAEDRDLWLRLTARYRTVAVEAPFWSYRQHARQSSRNQRRVEEGYAAALSKFFRDHSRFRHLRGEAWAAYHLDSAFAHRDAGAYRTALHHAVRSLLRHPLPISGLSTAAFARWRLLGILLMTKLGLGQARVRAEGTDG